MGRGANGGRSGGRSPGRGAAFAAGCVALLGAALPVAGQDGHGPAAAIEAARAGGTILLCRHAMTDDFREREPVDYDDAGTQRRLSPEGIEQSRALGQAWARLGVRIDDVVASPMDRAIRTAAEAVGPPRVEAIWHTNGGSYGGAPRDARRRALTRPVASGNRLVVSHISTMASVVPEVRGAVGEGDCAVVRPRPDGHELVGIVSWEAWGSYPPPGRLSPPPTPPSDRSGARAGPAAPPPPP